MPKRGYHHGNLRQALVEAALSLIEAKGPTGFTLSEAAKTAGVTPAAVYRHFEGREDLIAEAARQGYEIFADLMQFAFDKGQPSALASFEATGRAYLAFARKYPGHYIAMFESGISVNRTPELAAVATRARGVMEHAAAELSKHIPPEKRPPASMFSAHVWAMSHGVVELYARNSPGTQSPFAPEDLLESGIGVYLRGLGLIDKDLCAAMDIFTIFRGELTYPDGFASMVKRAPQQRAEYHGMQALLEEISQSGLEQLREQTVPPTENLDVENLASAAEKFQNIQAEFSGRSQLLALHALVIAASRRRNTPQIAQDLFQKCWQDHSRFLLEKLDMRWKLSALQTFRDLGTTEAQRRCAGELIIFFNMMKLYETERLYSGASAETAFDPKNRTGKKLPLKLTPYSLGHGDLDRNLLGMLWLSAEEDPVLAPLACHLLTEINRDKRNIFRRLRLMRRVLKRRRR